MARILTGIQSTGRPHLGNLLGAIIPAIALSKQEKNESLFFIADLHSFTIIRDAETLKENTYATAAAWLAFDFEIRYRSSPLMYASCPTVSCNTWCCTTVHLNEPSTHFISLLFSIPDAVLRCRKEEPYRMIHPVFPVPLKGCV